MPNTWNPWDTYPGLTQDRLVTVADVIRIAREETADDHRPEKFETNWSLGVRGFERTCGALTWAQQEYPWLSVVSGAGGGPVHYVITVGGHPVRFFKGEPEEIPSRYQQTSIFEIAELEKMFALDNAIPADRCLRIAIDIGVDGRPTDIFLVEMDEHTAVVTNIYKIPSAASNVISVTDFAPQIPSAVIPPVVAEAAEDVEAANDQNRKTGSAGE